MLEERDFDLETQHIVDGIKRDAEKGAAKRYRERLMVLKKETRALDYDYAGKGFHLPTEKLVIVDEYAQRDSKQLAYCIQSIEKAIEEERWADVDAYLATGEHLLFCAKTTIEEYEEKKKKAEEKTKAELGEEELQQNK